jgi:hypothetical protein
MRQFCQLLLCALEPKQAQSIATVARNLLGLRQAAALSSRHAGQRGWPVRSAGAMMTMIFHQIGHWQTSAGGGRRGLMGDLRGQAVSAGGLGIDEVLEGLRVKIQ